jgi:hypothetical protein
MTFREFERLLRNNSKAEKMEKMARKVWRLKRLKELKIKALERTRDWKD